MRLLVLAPHPDDDILGCGGWMHQLVQGGRNRIKVVFLTSGDLGGNAVQREQEAAAALDVVGVLDHEFWRYPDGQLPENAALGQRIVDLVRAWRPDSIALPAPSEAHADHRRLTRGTLHHLTGRWQGELLFYETVQAIGQPNRIVPIDLDTKLRALRHHTSQLQQYDYARSALAMATLRGVAVGAPAAEGFIVFDWDGSAQTFFTDRPLVSVIVRSSDGDLLRIALASLEAQIYDAIELIVVWHGASDAPLPVLETWLRHQVVRGPGGRAANLNVGLGLAHGRYIVFLDQDDVLLPEHIATLVAEMDSHPAPDLVHARYQVSVCERVGARVEVRSTGEPAGENRSANALLVENHIPIHSYLIETKTARALRFDETLDAYEDWDFLIRFVLSGARLRFCEEVVCEYRIYPEPDVDPTLFACHISKGFIPQLSRVHAKLAGALVTQVHPPLRTLALDLLHQADVNRDMIANLHQQVADLTQQLATHTATAEALARWGRVICGVGNDLNTAIGTDIVSLLAGKALASDPHFDVVVPVYNPVPEFLDACVDSILAQHCPHWTLWLVDDGSTHPAVVERLEKYPHTDPRIRVHRCAANGGIVAVTNIGVALGAGSWLVFVDHDDIVHPQALLELAACIQSRPATEPALDLIYTDSRTVDRTGAPLTSLHKPQWSPETLWHINYINHLCAVRRTAWDRVGGLLPGTDGSQDWDLVLRVGQRSGANVAHIPKVLYDWRVSEHSVAYRASVKPYAITAAAHALKPLLEQLVGSSLHTEPSKTRAGLQHRWTTPPQPLTVVIPTHDNAADLAPLLAFLQGLQRSDLFIVLVANNVRNPAMLDLLQRWAAEPRVRVLQHDQPFNWSELNNLACQDIRTPQILFLNDDIELLAKDTIEQLQAHLALDDRIGAVGALLRYPEADGGDIQHDGVLTGYDWVARNITNGADCSGALIPRNVAAVTGACLLTRRDAFEAVGGFEEALAVSFNDVDYCLKLRQHGWRIVQASDVEAIHRESRTRGALDSVAKLDQIQAELRWMQQRWGDALDDRCSMREENRYRGSLIMHVAE